MPCTATRRQTDHALRPRNPPTESVRLSTRSGPPRNKGDVETHCAAVRVAWRAEGLPHLGMSMPLLPAVENIQAHHHATRRFRCAHIPIPARTRPHRRPTANV